MADGTYAPQSPDLSSFFSTSSSPPKPTPSAQASYAPRSPNLSALGYQPASPQLPIFNFPTSASSTLASGSPSGYQPPVSHFRAAGHRQQQQSYGSEALGLGLGSGFGEDYRSGHGESYLPPIPDLPASHVEILQSPPRHPHAYQVPQQQSPSPYAQSHIYGSQSFKREDDGSFAPQQALSYPPQHQELEAGDMASRKRPAVKEENGQGPSMGIDVRTKFPVARIKRIMQADEEVGKVAQVTPVAVSKALELFMISLVTKSAALARASNSKRVTAQHLKHAIENDVQFDFLGEIVGKIAEGPDAGGAGAKRVKSDADGDSEDEEKKVKKKRGGGRKKGES